MKKHGSSSMGLLTALGLVLLLVPSASASHDIVTIWLSNRSGEQIYYSRYLNDENTKDWKAYLLEPSNGMPSSGVAQVRVHFGSRLHWLRAANWPATAAHPWHNVRMPASKYDAKCWMFVPGPKLVNDPETCRRLYQNPNGRVAPGH